jgi:hypothetical protein
MQALQKVSVNGVLKTIVAMVNYLKGIEGMFKKGIVGKYIGI